MTTDQDVTYEQMEELQRDFCKQLDHLYVAASPDAKVGIALETQGRLPINGSRHPPEGDTTGWYLWSGEDFPSDDDAFSPVHARHLIQLCPEALKFLGLPPGYRFLIAGDHLDVWYDPDLLEI